MFLHIGENLLLAKREIIAILKWETEQERNSNTLLFKRLQEEKETVYVDKEAGKTKSLIMTDHIVYLSPISCHTLKRRGNDILSLERNILAEAEQEQEQAE